MKTTKITDGELVMLALVGISDGGFPYALACSASLPVLDALRSKGFISTRRTEQGGIWMLASAGRAVLRGLPKDFWSKGPQARTRLLASRVRRAA